MHSDVVAERLRDTDDDVCYEAPDRNCVVLVALMVDVEVDELTSHRPSEP